jgi:Ca-activated chloride channel family protein
MDQPDRIGMVKKALRILVERLDQSDRIAIVTFDTKVNVLLPYTNATEKEKILDAVDSIKCGGETNMGEGFRYAYQLAHEHFVPGAENRVVVMSDGMANLGHTEAEEILCTIKPYIECGIYCSIYGVGTKSYNDAMLQRLANKGNGVYAFIDSEAEARRLFVDELSASINTIASDVKIQVEFNPLMVERYRLMGYEKRQLKKEDFRDDAVDAGEVGSGQSATALYEVQLKSTKPIYPQNVIGNVIDLQRFSQIAVVRVRYKRLDTGAVEEIEQRISTADLVDNFDNADVYFRLASAVAEFAELLRNSPYAAPGGFEAVARVIERVAGELHWDGRVRELAELIHIAPTLSRGE